MALGLPPVTPFVAALDRGMVWLTGGGAQLGRRGGVQSGPACRVGGEEKPTLTTNLISVHVF